MSTEITEPLVRRIERALAKDHVWVSPQLRSQIPPAVEHRIEAAVADKKIDVVLVDIAPDDPLTQGDPEQLAAIISDDTHFTGTVITPDQLAEDSALSVVPGSGVDELDTLYVAKAAKLEHPSDLGAQVLAAVPLIGSGHAEQTFDRLASQHPDLAKKLFPYDVPRTGSTGTRDSTDGSGGHAGHGGQVVLGVVAALIAIVVVATLVRARGRRGRASGVTSDRGRTTAGSAQRSFELPKAVLETVRAAEDHHHEQQAQDAVLALGEAIDASDMGATNRRTQGSWQAALDHYDVARRILDRDHSPADTIGALVLARRGRSALDAARAGRGWTPTPGCYFNPLHTGAIDVVRWSDGDQRVVVPACTPCRDAVEAGHEPADVLDFVHDGKPRHYFKLDLGAWSRTGYGALDTDLLGALLTR